MGQNKRNLLELEVGLQNRIDVKKDFWNLNTNTSQS